MILSRRTALLVALTVPLPLAARAAEPRLGAVVRVGVLRFGTVAWELDVIRRHGLDAAEGIAIVATEFAAAQATQVALQAGAVDVTVQDWLWVARQRADGADWTYATFSTAIGALLAPPGSPVQAVTDLPGRRLGIAGSPLDKSWLILRAYAAKLHGIDLDRVATKSFGPPPLLAEQAKSGRLDAVLTFWPFAARAQAAGARRVLAMEDAVRGLGIPDEMPVAGYVFSEHWANANRAAVAGLLAASRAARVILAASDDEWQRLRPLTGAADDAELEQLKTYYRSGIPHAEAAGHAQAAARLFGVLAGIGGPTLVGSAQALPPGTFWQPS
jgi:NitT/TauT family transport system substrate-binding protein